MDNALLTQLRILSLSKIKPNFSELGREYGYDRRTVKKYYDGYEGKPANRNKPSKLDKHYDLIRTKLLIKGTTSRAVYEFILSTKDPNIGTYSNFNKYIARKGLAPKRSNKGHPRFETSPGYQAQVDWKEDITLANRFGEIFIFQVFNYKLGHSRYCHFTYKTTKTRQDVFDCLIASFIATGGVPKEILFDNMASIVDLKDGRRNINVKMRAFAKDFDFRIRLAKPRCPCTKGKVESANKFIDWLRPYEGEFETESDLIDILAKINRKVNEQICQATNVPPLLLFQKEKEYLKHLPDRKVVEPYMSHDRQITVQKDSLFVYNGCRYSVPASYIGKTVSVKQCDGKLQVYYNMDLISVHTISPKRLNYKKEHYRELMSLSIKDVELADRIAEANLRQMDDFL